MASNPRILVAEDDAVVAADIRGTLEGMGYEVVDVVHEGEEAVSAAGAAGPDLVLMDIRLPGPTDGIDAARELGRAGIPVIYVTAYADDRTLERAEETAPFGYVVKPFDERELKSAVEVGLHRARLERRLRESEERFSATLRCIGDAVIATDADGAITFMNPVAERLTGWSRAEATGRSVEDIVRFADEATGERVESPIRRALRDDVVKELSNHTKLVRTDGGEIPVSDSAAPIVLDGGENAGAVIVFRDVSEEREAREALRRSEERYRRLFEEDVAGNYIATPEGELRACNEAYVEILGFESVEEATSTGVEGIFADDAEREAFVDRVRREGKVELVEHELRTRDGTPVHVVENVTGIFDDVGGLTELHGHVLDITERRKLRSQLLQSQKMEAVGRLAGGIAHDFNNLLTSITASAALLLDDTDLDAEAREDARVIERAAERAADLTRQLLAVSRRQVLRPEAVELNRIVGEMTSMLDRIVGEHIRIVTELDADVEAVRADPGQLEQVILNLVVNAREAMPEGGRIRIATGSARIGDGTDSFEGEAEPGEYTLFTVSDDGAGMEEEVLEHVFEPFYSTKEEGTGLGLATVYGIVKQTGGRVTVYSDVGVGTTVRVYLPTTDEEEEAEETRPRPSTTPSEGGEEILVVEDSEAVRTVAERMLRVLGYSVTTAATAEEALRIWEEREEPVDLLLTDVIMPEMSGLDLVRALREEAPDLRVLFTSGHADPGLVELEELEGMGAFLEKPFSPAELAGAVRTALEEVVGMGGPGDAGGEPEEG